MVDEPIRLKLVALAEAHFDQDRQDFPVGVTSRERAEWLVDEVYDEVMVIMRKFHSQFEKEFDL